MKTSIFLLFPVLVAGLLIVGCKKEMPAEDEPAAAPEAAAEADVKTEKENVAVESNPEVQAGAAEAAESTGIAACDEYMKAFDKYMLCDAIPQATKDATKQGMVIMKTSWVTLTDAPDDAKQTASDSCQQAMEGLKQGAKAMNCDI